MTSESMKEKMLKAIFSHSQLGGSGSNVRLSEICVAIAEKYASAKLSKAGTIKKRDRFAARAMQGMLSANIRYGSGGRDYEALAKDAVRHADALLKELQKKDCQD